LTCLPPRSDNPDYGSGEVIVIIVVNAYRKSTSTSVIGDWSTCTPRPHTGIWA